MLVNISNHLSKYWDDKQITEAQCCWGGVVDVPLPNIDPNLNGEAVVGMAEVDSVKYRAVIEQYSEVSAFHIMGESVYCFHIIRLLKEMGYKIVASTSRRNVDYHGKDKISVFEFVKFREY